MTRSDVIRESSGNLLQADVEALVNTVNTAGVMGKGIALQFRRAFPAMFKDYARAAKSGQIYLGQMHVWQTQQLSGPRFVINFPTKGHWKSASRLADVERGLDDLVRVIKELGIRSVAVPPLGCGNGGLDWSVVEPVIRAKLAGLVGVDVLVFPPAGAPSASSMANEESLPPMTQGRAALVRLLARYRQHAMEDASLIEVQKLMYFLQVAGEPLRLEYSAGHYGPYADRLRHVLKVVEGHYLTGFGDGSVPVQRSEPLTLLPGAENAADDEIARHPETAERVGRVVELVEGFETAYALELLATVHWLLHHDLEARDLDTVVERVQTWSPRKGRMFTADHIRVALETLESRGWTPQFAAAR